MLSKITISGQVTKSPEKRFTQNNFAITSFEINIGTNEDIKLLKCTATGKMAEEIAEKVKSLNTIMVNGRLIIQVKEDKKNPMIEISQYLILNADSKAPEYSEIDYTDELIGEDEIPF